MFYGLEKEDGTIICDQEEILLETKNFYKNLYKSKDNTLEDINLENYMRDTTMMKITEEESNSIEGLLTFKEITDTLRKMKHDKSPGTSGFTAELF